MSNNKSYSIVKKWRGLHHHELTIWTHVRLDNIEKNLNIIYREPNLKEITDKLQNEATEKETYTTNATFSPFEEYFSKIWVILKACFRKSYNILFTHNKGNSQDKTTNK